MSAAKKAVIFGVSSQDGSYLADFLFSNKRANSQVSSLSGGERNRVHLAKLLKTGGNVLLLDEPTTALDATVQIQILLLLRELQKETGMSVIFVTHDIGAAVEVADRIAVMYAGRIVEMGDVAHVVNQPLHPYTQGLLASTVNAENRGKPLLAVPGSPPDLSNLPPGCSFASRCAYATSQCQTEVPPTVATGASALACWYPVSLPQAI